jgi:hypothetical protein
MLIAPAPAGTTGPKRLRVVAGWDDDIEIIYGNPLTAAWAVPRLRLHPFKAETGQNPWQNPYCRFFPMGVSNAPYG